MCFYFDRYCQIAIKDINEAQNLETASSGSTCVNKLHQKKKKPTKKTINETSTFFDSMKLTCRFI